MRQGRHCAARARVISPASSSTFKCFEIAGMLISNGSARYGDGGFPGHQVREDGAASRVGQRRKSGGQASGRGLGARLEGIVFNRLVKYSGAAKLSSRLGRAPKNRGETQSTSGTSR